MQLTGKLADNGLHAFDDESRLHNGILLPRLWLVVADREKALIYRKTTQGIECIAKAKPGHSKTHPEDSDSGGAPHHGYDAHSRKRQDGDTAFVKKLSAWLDKAEQEKIFDSLILVAAPRTLGDIRSCLGNDAQKRLAAEINKDLAKFSDKEIEEHIAKAIWS